MFSYVAGKGSTDHFPAGETKIELVDGISDHKLTLCPVPFHDEIEPSSTKITYPDFNSADDTSIPNHEVYNLQTIVPRPLKYCGFS